jgi:peptide/nickel transport system substrate-binding protein
MKPYSSKTALGAVLGLTLGAVAGAPALAASPQSGGTLDFVVAGESPSKDGHRETTYATIHPYAPMYSLLIRVNPEDPQSSDFVCDLCVGDIPKPTDDGTKYTFKLRTGVKFHDGQSLTAADVKATYDKIIFPPEGVKSARKSFFKMVDSVSAPSADTVVFNLKFPSGAFLPALATPYNWIYSKKDMETHGYSWHSNNVNGSGPFMFVQHQPGAFVEAKKNPNYHHQGQPYLDGYKAVIAKKMSVRIQSIRGNRAAIEFRGFPPKARDDLVNALGDKLTVQESDWNCVLLATPNQQRKPFDDPRVRRALTLGIDRWEGSKYLSQIAIVKTVGGVVFPGHPLAASQSDLESLAGYGRDIEANRAEARRLLKEAGAENLVIDYNNRDVDQPYKVVGTWLIDQWKQIGVTAKQTVRPTPQFYATLRQKSDFDVSIDFNCQSVVNPIADVTKFLGSAGNNYGNYEDPELEAIYDKLLRAGSVSEQKKLMRQYEKRALDEQAHMIISLWWYKINPHRSYVQGWKIAPSHYLNQQLDNVWLDKSKM